MTTDPKTSNPSGPVCSLLVMCCECGKGLEAPLPLDHDTFSHLLAQHAWFVSVMSQPQGPDVPILFGALCATCAPNIFPPEILRAAEAQRQKLLEGSR